MNKPVLAHVLALSAWTLKKAHIVISCQEAQTIPDSFKYIISVFCYNFKSQTIIHINTLACVKTEI